MEAVREAKRLLRRQMRECLRAQEPAERDRLSHPIRDRLLSSELWRTSRRVLAFAAMPEEVDTWPLLEEALAQGRTLAVPRFDPGSRAYLAARVRNLQKDLILGAFGLREPREELPSWPLNQLDLVLVPGLAFAPDGRRLGRGKGYFDRLCASTSGITCGLAFDFQIVETVPHETHDITLDCVLTPSRGIDCGSRGVFE